MNNIHTKKAVIWLSKNNLYFYIEGLPSIYNMPFFGESVKYFDVINETKLINQLEEFISLNKMPALNAYFIVGPDALIEKEFILGSDHIIKQFLDMIPYETVYSKKIIKQKSVRVAAFNGDFYRIISNVLEKHMGKIISILPYFLVSQSSLTNQTASFIIKKAESLKNETMKDILEMPDVDNLTLQTQSKKERSFLPILIFIFIVMLVILVIILLNSRNKPINLKTISPTPTSIFIPSPTNFLLSPIPQTNLNTTSTATDSAL